MVHLSLMILVRLKPLEVDDEHVRQLPELDPLTRLRLALALVALPLALQLLLLHVALQAVSQRRLRRLLVDGQTQEQEWLELMALSLAVLTLHGRLLLPLEDVHDHALVPLQVSCPGLCSPFLPALLPVVVVLLLLDLAHRPVQVLVKHVQQVRKQLLAILLN